jgi:hypothetical protein
LASFALTDFEGNGCLRSVRRSAPQNVLSRKEKEMANGSIHPKEQELKERLGKDYETETPPPGAVIVGEGTVPQERAADVKSPVNSTADR